jgi:hypothetical protein
LHPIDIDPKEDNLDSSNFSDFVFGHLAVILAIVGLGFALIKLLSHPKPHTSSAQAQLTETEINEAKAAGQRARDDVKRRFGKHFGGRKP